MKYYCVTPCLNSEDYIEETMLSVLHQTLFHREDCFLYYVIRDGGSSDNTVKIIKQVKAKFINKSNIQILFYSETDSGMYDALAEGFNEDIDSDVYSYINAGDFYSIHAFEIVYDIFSQYDVNFLTGINAIYNNKSHLVNFFLPFEYNRYFLKKGLYGTMLPFVQQESTFWHRTVHQKIDFNKLKEFKYAGDFFLWKTFINDSPLYIVSAWLGGFKKHTTQLSSIFTDEYRTEIKQNALTPTALDYFLAYLYKVFNYLPNGFKKKISPHMFEYDHSMAKYCPTKRTTVQSRSR